MTGQFTAADRRFLRRLRISPGEAPSQASSLTPAAVDRCRVVVATGARCWRQARPGSRWCEAHSFMGLRKGRG